MCFWWGNLNEEGHVENLGIDGRTILKWILNIYAGAGVECVKLVQ
jgi:hypothetical protein